MHAVAIVHINGNSIIEHLFWYIQYLPGIEIVGRGVHSTPSPSNPGLQLHSKLPGRFVQNAFTSQLCNPVLHSLISVAENKRQ